MAHRPDWYYCRDPRLTLVRGNDPPVARLEIECDEDADHTHDYDEDRRFKN